jgi:hypothetical protein
LLLGCVIGLWPFQQGVPPVSGDIVKGRIVTAETIGDVDPEDWRVEIFRPTAGQAAMSLALVIAGAMATAGIARVGGGSAQEEPSAT